MSAPRDAAHGARSGRRRISPRIRLAQRRRSSTVGGGTATHTGAVEADVGGRAYLLFTAHGGPGRRGNACDLLAMRSGVFEPLLLRQINTAHSAIRFFRGRAVDVMRTEVLQGNRNGRDKVSKTQQPPAPRCARVGSAFAVCSLLRSSRRCVCSVPAPLLLLGRRSALLCSALLCSALLCSALRCAVLPASRRHSHRTRADTRSGAAADDWPRRHTRASDADHRRERARGQRRGDSEGTTDEEGACWRRHSPPAFLACLQTDRRPFQPWRISGRNGRRKRRTDAAASGVRIARSCGISADPVCRCCCAGFLLRWRR